MKNFTKLAVALAAGVIVSTGASAATICSSCSYSNATNNNLYIGALNATSGDNSFMNSGATLQATGAFTQNYIFSFSPNGQAATNLLFLPTNNISNFTLQLYSTTALGCPVLAAGATMSSGCTSFALGSLVATGTTNPNFVANLPFTPISSGQYLIRVTGTVTASGGGGAPDNGYSGQVTTTTVPEPGSLALAGIALFGMGAAALRKRKA